MKRIFLMLVMSAAVLCMAPELLPAQTAKVDSVAVDDDIDPKLRFYKEKYEASYANTTLELVFKAIKKMLADQNTLIANEKNKQDDNGLFTGSIKSDFIIIAEGDTAAEITKPYSLDFPYIPAGAWRTGRIQYRFVVKETNDNKVNLTLFSEMSGFESYVTRKVHFWKSNGILETKLLEKLAGIIESMKKK